MKWENAARAGRLRRWDRENRLEKIAARNLPATEKQRRLVAKLRRCPITEVPAMTRGQASEAIDALLAERKRGSA